MYLYHHDSIREGGDSEQGGLELAMRIRVCLYLAIEIKSRKMEGYGKKYAVAKNSRV
jgi:hypothetical protein